MSSNIERGRRDLLEWDASRPKNFYDADKNLDRVLSLRLSRDRLTAERSALSKVGELSARDLSRLGREANLDENLPRLERWSGLGVRTEEVVFHPSYHAMGRLIWETGMLARYREPGSETVQLAMLYLFGQNGELGHLCPLACTAGLIKVLQGVATDAQKSRWLPPLLTTRYEDRLHASQFLTEIQGGSDVGANAVVAQRSGEGWSISGEKWFCSVADASLFLMTARPEGAPEGTKGLGLFLVPRMIDGRLNAFAIRRLKRKLGTRAMASGEIDFLGAHAEAVGPIDRGFKNVVERVLDTSRVYNAVCCASSMRRAYVEASSFAHSRRAFGQVIDQYPLVQEAIATLRAESMAATAATFRLAAQSDQQARGALDESRMLARRMAVNVNKYWTSVRNTQMVRLAMEVLGGNGTIESFSVIPQLYRDAMVLESWEGTHNTLVQQVMRDAERLKAHEAFLVEQEEALDRIPTGEKKLVDRVRAGLRALHEPLRRAADGAIDQRFGRRIVDQMALVHALVAMLEELAHDPIDGAKRGAITLLADRDLRAEIAPPLALDQSLLRE
jgi:alkylation response protein AidB-like acyl-CoA dehydrogenase